MLSSAEGQKQPLSRKEDDHQCDVGLPPALSDLHYVAESLGSFLESLEDY